MRSFVLLENASDRKRNRIIISVFVVFMIAILLVVYYGTLFGLSVFNTTDQNSAEVGDFNITSLDKTSVKCGGLAFSTYIAKSDEDKRRGLSIFDKIATNEAMLFVFDQPSALSFWMKDMKFAIDIVWLNEDKKIVHIENNITPDTYPKTFQSEASSVYALEFKAKIIKNSKIKIGDYCEFNF